MEGLETPGGDSVLIRSVKNSDEEKLRNLLFGDVYHWTRWVKPILMDGVVGLLAKPILYFASLVCLLGLLTRLDLALVAAASFALLLLAVAIGKLVLYLNYIWSTPELKSGGLAEVGAKPGTGFFVAEVAGRVVGCVAVQKTKNPKVGCA